MTDESTRVLVQRIQTGDAVATEDLFSRYLPQVTRMVALELGVSRFALPAEAEDLVQDAILRALRALPNYEIRSPGSFAAWLSRIVLNVVRQRRHDLAGRKQKALWQRYGDLELTDSFFPGKAETPSRIVTSAESNEQLEKALLSLPGLYRRVLSLRHLGGATYAEIAQELGKTEASCRKIAQRAIEMLRAAMAK